MARFLLLEKQKNGVPKKQLSVMGKIKKHYHAALDYPDKKTSFEPVFTLSQNRRDRRSSVEEKSAERADTVQLFRISERSEVNINYYIPPFGRYQTIQTTITKKTQKKQLPAVSYAAFDKTLIS